MKPLTALLAALAVGAGLVAAAVPAPAHEGDGILVVESSTPSPAGREYQVRLTWENDGHAALDATVTATAVAPDGSAATPVALAPVDQDGRYVGAVALPTAGTWTVRFTAVTPTALIEVQEEVAAATTTTAGEATSTTAPSSTAATSETATSGPSGDESGSDGFPWVPVIVGLVAVATGVALAMARSARRPGEGA